MLSQQECKKLRSKRGCKQVVCNKGSLMASYWIPKISLNVEGLLKIQFSCFINFFLNRRYNHVSRSFSIFNMKSFLCVYHNSGATGIIRTLHPTFKLHERNPFVVSMLTEARLMSQRGKRGLCKQVTLRHSLLLFSKRTTLDFLLVH